MNKMKYKLLAALTAVLLLAGCGGQSQPPAASSGAASGGESQVASSAEMAKPEELDLEGLTPVYGNELKDGTYPVEVDSSSSMFRVVDCTLTVEQGEMTAVMTMSGTGYLKLYMGTGEEAAAAAEEEFIPFAENSAGAHTYTVPVEALDQAVDCTAFSKNKEKWYDRTLVFRANSLPREAFVDQTVVDAASLGLADGRYTVEVALEGGSGRVTVASPAQLRVEAGEAFATVVWSSPNYNYMKVDEVRYDPIPGEENSTFEIPVAAFDSLLEIKANTVAMSEPHEIDYTLKFDSGTIQRVEG